MIPHWKQPRQKLNLNPETTNAQNTGGQRSVGNQVVEAQAADADRAETPPREQPRFSAINDPTLCSVGKKIIMTRFKNKGNFLIVLEI